MAYMKKMTVWSVALLALLSSSAMAQVNRADQKAIESLVARESEQFYARNYEQWSQCYTQNADVQWVCVEKGDVVLEAYTWQQLGPFVASYLQANPTPMIVSFVRRNHVWRLLGPDKVWLTFDEAKTTGDRTEYFKATRIVEKRDGKWTITGMFSYPAKL